MQNRTEKLDSIWDNNKNLKENIITVISTDLPTPPVKNNGFFNPKESEEKRMYKDDKDAFLEILGKEDLVLEDLYKTFLFAKTSKKLSKEMSDKIDYLILKIEADDPELAESKQKFENDIEHAMQMKHLMY